MALFAVLIMKFTTQFSSLKHISIIVDMSKSYQVIWMGFIYFWRFGDLVNLNPHFNPILSEYRYFIFLLK